MKANVRITKPLTTEERIERAAIAPTVGKSKGCFKKRRYVDCMTGLVFDAGNTYDINRRNFDRAFHLCVTEKISMWKANSLTNVAS